MAAPTFDTLDFANRLKAGNELKGEWAQVRRELKLIRWMLGTVLAASLSLIVGMLSLVIKAFF